MADRAMRQRTNLGLSLLALVAVAALAAGGFALGARLTAQPGGPALAAKQVLRLANVGGEAPKTLDPALVGDPNSAQIIALIATGLVKLDAKTLQVVPDLAAGWNISTNGKTYTFHLRNGLRFSNGDPLTASDVAYSIDRAFDPSLDGKSGSASYYLGINDVPNIVGAPDRAAGKSSTIIGTGVVVINDTTLQINLIQPAAYFLAQLTTQVSLVVDKKVVQRYGSDWWDGHPVGSGPFTLKSWQLNVQLTFVPNPYWYGAKTHLTEIDMPVIPWPDTAFQRFLAKAIDVDNAVGALNYAAAKGLGAKEFFEGPALSIFSLVPNDAFPPFDNVTVRQAFAEAVDRETIASQILGGTYFPSDHLVPLGNPGYDAGLKGLPFNPQDARAKLTSVYPDASLMPPVSLTYWSDGSGSTDQLAALLQHDFQTYLGVHINLAPNPGSFLNGFPEFQFVMSSWIVDYPDPQDWLSLQIAGGGTNFKNAQVDQLLAQADVEGDQSKRFSLYHQAEELAVDNVALIPFAQGKNIVVFQKDVHGYALLPNGLTSPDLWANVYICASPC